MLVCVSRSPQPKRHLDQFSRICTTEGSVSLYITTGRPFSPQNCPFAWGFGPPSNTWFLWLTRDDSPNGISIGSPAFCEWGLRLWQTDRQTRYSRCNNRPHLRITAMRLIIMFIVLSSRLRPITTSSSKDHPVHYILRES